MSTDIHTIQSHIEESKLNEQLLNALVEFKSHSTEADIEQIGTIAINFYFNEERKHLICLFSSSRANSTILEHLEQFLITKLATILNEIEFYRNEVKEYTLSYTKRIESEWAYEFISST